MTGDGMQPRGETHTSHGPWTECALWLAAAELPSVWIDETGAPLVMDHCSVEEQDGRRLVKNPTDHAAHFTVRRAGRTETVSLAPAESCVLAGRAE